MASDGTHRSGTEPSRRCRGHGLVMQVVKNPAEELLTGCFSGACDRNRTRDHRFTRAALYQLSYTGL